MYEKELEFVKKETGLSTVDQISVQITVQGWLRLMSLYKKQIVTQPTNYNNYDDFDSEKLIH